MEGGSIISSKLKFVESKKKFRVSPNFNNNSTKKLITSANNHGLVIVACSDNTIKSASVDLLNLQDKPEIVNLTQFRFITNLTFKPTLITVARYGFSSVLLICGQSEVNQCPVVEAIDLDTQESIGKQELPELGDSEIVDYAWHPNYYDSIVALCTNSGCLLTLGINRKTRCVSMLFNDPLYGALTCCWSPKGKNLAIGMINGQILRLEPVITTDTFNYKKVDKSVLTFNHIKQDHQVTKLRWINKTFLMSVHSRPANTAGPETVYSLITVKPDKPYLYWTNLIFENQNLPNYIVHLVNLSNSVFCMSNASGEAAVIGVDGAKEAKTNELNDWRSIIIDEEGARIELPLDGNNRETYPMGVTTAFLKNNSIDQPIVIFYTSDGVICPYLASHAENILKLPEFQQPQDCPVTLKAPPPVPQQQNIFGGMMNSFSLSAPQKLSTPWASLSQQPQPLQQQQQPQVPQPQAQPNIFSSMTSSFNLTAPLKSLSTTWGSLSLQAQPQAQAETQKEPLALLNPEPKQQQQQSQPPPQLQIQQQLQAPPQTQPRIQSQPPSQSQIQASLQKQIQAPPLALPQSQSQSPSQAQAQAPTLSQPKTQSQPQSQTQNQAIIKKFIEDIGTIKKGIEFNEVFMSLLDEVNSLRVDLDEVQEIHKIHHDALETIKEDVDSLDIGMLENLYLIEYIKTRSRSRRKSVHPLIYKKVEGIKVKSKMIAGKLRELENHVEAAWEEFVRRNALENKNRKINSVDIVYKTLANNQKIIKVLKNKVADHNDSKELNVTNLSMSSLKSPNDSTYSSMIVPTVNASKIRAFREYLSSRGVAPVRRPGK